MKTREISAAFWVRFFKEVLIGKQRRAKKRGSVSSELLTLSGQLVLRMQRKWHLQFVSLFNTKQVLESQEWVCISETKGSFTTQTSGVHIFCYVGKICQVKSTYRQKKCIKPQKITVCFLHCSKINKVHKNSNNCVIYYRKEKFKSL